MSGILDLLKGERGILATLIIIAITIFVITGHATFEQWSDAVTWIFGLFVAGKTATTVTGLIKTETLKQGGV